MKKAIVVFLIFSSACKPSGYFTSPNDVHKEKVIVYLKNQEKIVGDINIDLEHDSRLPGDFKPTLEIMPEGKTSWQKLNIQDITAYSMGSDYFPVKNVDVDMNGANYMLFVKRMTAENSRIQLYQLYESGKSNYTGEPVTHYYLSFPGFAPLETINAKGSQLVPNFDSKMSNLVEDCPNLAKKIRKKEKGYFLAMATFNVKTTPEVLMRIIDEYNSCTLTKNNPTN